MSVKNIKLVLAILLFLGLLPMPYGYFQLMHFAALFGFSILAYNANEKHDKTEMIIYICLAILFQPFFKFPLGGQVWNVVEAIVGIGLLISFLGNRK